MRRLLPLLALAATGCAAHYRVDLLNATPHPVEIGIVPYGGPDHWSASGHPHAAVAPGGRFDYRMLRGDRSGQRCLYARVTEGGLAEAVIPIGDTEVFHGRIRAEGDRLVIVRVER